MSGQLWRIASASVRGAGHEKSALPCQDAHQCIARPDGILVVAVADGAGSASLAEVGASIAVAHVTDSLCRSLDQVANTSALDDASLLGQLNAAIGDARNAIENEAKRRDTPVYHLATTLILVAAAREFVAAVQVGDGAVVIAQPDNQPKALTHPGQSEYLNETVFLTSEEAMTAAQSIVWRGTLAHLAVFSDGLQMAALRMPQGEPHPGFFTPLFKFVAGTENADVARESLIAFLSSPRMRERTDDDVTLVLGSLRD